MKTPKETSSKPSHTSKPSTPSKRAVKQEIKWPIMIGLFAMLIGVIIIIYSGSNLSSNQKRSNNTSSNSISHTPTKSEFSTRTPELNANPTSLTSQLSSIQWQLIFKDQFDSNENDWDLGLREADSSSFQPDIEDGKLYFLSKSKTDIPANDLRAAGNTTYSDFVLSFDVELINGYNSSPAYGVFFRYTGDSNYYGFVITEYFYGFFITKGATYRTIIDWKNHSVLKPNDVNHITVVAIGSEFAFIVNEKTLEIIRDNELNTGRAGIYVQTSGPDDVLIEFDNLKIWVPENSSQSTDTPVPTIKSTISLQPITTSTASQKPPNIQNPPTMTPACGFDDPDYPCN
ncbi:MAG: DUF1080 domain-containing protein [Anaerolineaceae bacterium]|nr:DUF1080 domain-containing protein [Anaerolineaceae bacterium]